MDSGLTTAPVCGKPRAHPAHSQECACADPGNNRKLRALAEMAQTLECTCAECASRTAARSRQSIERVTTRGGVEVDRNFFCMRKAEAAVYAQRTNGRGKLIGATGPEKWVGGADLREAVVQGAIARKHTTLTIRCFDNIKIRPPLGVHRSSRNSPKQAPSHQAADGTDQPPVG
jgi:hypothetical protein